MNSSIVRYLFLSILAATSFSAAQHVSPPVGWFSGISGDEILMVRIADSGPPRAAIDSVIYYGSLFGGALHRDTILYYSISLDNQNCFATTYYGGQTGGLLDGFRTEGCFQSNIELTARIIYGNVFVGEDTSTYFTLTPGSITTGMRREPAILPAASMLFNNYPNPFNPTTTISFGVASQAFVSLKIFDQLGREISVLVSEELQEGVYSKRWDAAGMASGVYYSRLQTGSHVMIKKLLLLR